MDKLIGMFRGPLAAQCARMIKSLGPINQQLKHPDVCGSDAEMDGAIKRLDSVKASFELVTAEACGELWRAAASGRGDSPASWRRRCEGHT